MFYESFQISESYAFLPREAVTRFLMSCSECQKRMHLNPDGTDHKDNGKPPTLVTSMIDYNMPITMAYMKHMKLQLLNSQQDEDESSIESDEFDMSDSTRMSAVNSDLSSNLEERMQSPQTLHGQQDVAFNFPSILILWCSSWISGVHPGSLVFILDPWCSSWTPGVHPGPLVFILNPGVHPESCCSSWTLGVHPGPWVFILDPWCSSWTPGVHPGFLVFILDPWCSSWTPGVHPGSLVFILDPWCSSWTPGVHPGSLVFILDPGCSSWIPGVHPGPLVFILDPWCSSWTPDDSAAESFNGNETLGHSSVASGGAHGRETGDSSSDGKTGLEQEDQPLNLSDSPLSAQLTSEYRIDDQGSNGKNKYKNLLISDLKMEREARENGSKSPAHSYSSYDSGKNESVDRGAEDLSLNRGDEDEDEHDEHEDAEKVTETDGVEAERLKAFNMFVRLFVDENLDRMVPISKQPKEKIQAIIDSCRRQFPEYQERARKRIRTYLKSCRRMKRSGFEMSRPIPSHLTSAVAESILASACESESRNAAKRMRLDKAQVLRSVEERRLGLEKCYALVIHSYQTKKIYGGKRAIAKLN
ncbi:Nucleolar protein 4 [Microtus ochrogaster]|uniref:Nucleolar protein 4 n=1 Tax=Microtus ochrogaster TaxID=79684 RepID=A0A8J6FVU8_MICOH|nr:Nucleolar protein 4 [Microtus ochrogaster]